MKTTTSVQFAAIPVSGPLTTSTVSVITLHLAATGFEAVQDLGRPDLLVARLGQLVRRRQIDPEQESGDSFRAYLRYFLVHDASSGGHPLPVARSNESGIAEGIGIGTPSRCLVVTGSIP